MTEFEPTGDPIQAEALISATPEACYRAFADPEGIARWFVDRAEGESRVGETLTWYFDEFGYAIPYEVVAADKGERFAIGYRAPGRPPGLIEVTFQAQAGRTRVRLVNHGFLRKDGWDEEYEGVVSGWTMALATLTHQLENHAGRDRRSFLLMQPADLDLLDCVPYYRTAAGLSSWLTTSGELGEVGSQYSLSLIDGGPLGNTVSGTVLAHSAWETLLSWTEADGVLCLKAFSMGPGKRMVALHASSWSWDEQTCTAHRACFEPALGRLVETLTVSRRS